MKPWHRYTLTIVLGLVFGTSVALYQVRGGLAAGQVTNGPWATAKTYGTKDADALTRARVALSGLLALPAKEAMYFTAKTDSAGRPLDGKCRYGLSGVPLPGRWWSVTLYDMQGRLRRNPKQRWSMGNLPTIPNPPMVKVPDRWAFEIGPSESIHDQFRIPTGGPGPFELTLRVYHPTSNLINDSERANLPEIVGTC